MSRSASAFVTDEIEQVIRRAHIVRPSMIHTDFWFGSWAPGAKLTTQQQRALVKRGRDPSAVDLIDVQVAASNRELWWPSDSGTPQRRLCCPIIGKRGDRLKILAPNGYATHCYPDGTLKRKRQ